MRGYNKAIIAGHLGQDPDMRETQSGTKVCNFSIATGEGTKDNPKTEWHRIVAWDKTAELCAQYLKKGAPALVEGRIQTRSWEDKEGVTKYTTEIVAFNVQFLGSRDDGAAPQGGAGTSGAADPNQNVDPKDEECPF